MKAATREQILAVARQYGYAARSDSTAPTIAIVVYDSDTAIAERRLGHGYGSFDQRVLSGVNAAAQERGVQLMLAHSAGTPGAGFPPALAPQAVTGALLLGGMFPEPFVLEVARRMPAVLAGSFIPGGQVNCVHPDYQTGALLAVEHLVSLGHRRIALLNGPADTRSSADKETGYREALRVAGLPIDERRIVGAADFGVEHGKLAVARLLEQDDVSAVVAADDALAFGAVRLLTERGRRVPTDVSVVGFYNGPLAAVGDPPLTTIDVHHHTIGREAARRLLELQRDPRSPALRIVVAPRLVTRASTGMAPRA